MIEKLEDDLLPPPAEAGTRFEAPAARAPESARAPAPQPIDSVPEPETVEDGAEPALALGPEELRGALEAVLFAVAEPITIRALAELFRASVHDVRAAVEDLRLEYIEHHRAFRVEDIAGGVQLLTVSRYDPWVRRLRQKEREGKLSPAALETLSVIAYKQPLGKADLEAIRGVGCGPTLKTLLERGLIQVVGRSEALGRPLLYGTTRRFLESFGIGSVRELPQPELQEKSGGDRPPRAAAAPAASPESPAAAEAPLAPHAEAPEPPDSLTTPSGPELS